MLVVNLRVDSFDVYIGRGSRWGNPYRISPEMDRAQVIEEYRRLLWWQIQAGVKTLDDLLDLEGKTLGCYCKPADCHGDVIVKAVSWARDQVDAQIEAGTRCEHGFTDEHDWEEANQAFVCLGKDEN